MSSIKCLIVDDEKEARDGLKKILAKDQEVEVIGTCKNGLEAIESLSNEKIDLLFLDIQMPGINGFEVLNTIQADKRPPTIFVTAYDQFALKAFEYHAIDYLLKPYSESRFIDALNNAKSHMLKSPETFEGKIEKLLISYLQDADQDKNELVNVTSKTKRLVIKSSGKIILLNFDDIRWIEGCDYFIKVHAVNAVHLVNETLKGILGKLPEQFLRIHKSSIINGNRIKLLEHLSNNEYQVELDAGDKLKVSRTYKKAMDEYLGRG
ncbi:MAG: LytTR family DNA-binding domain-containing protein [Cyclobacteriaceae bacterium]